jgi:DNA-binding MarR family transcriptional regulator
MPDFVECARRIADECPSMRARQASRLLSRVVDEELRSLPIQSSQLSLLVAVARHGDQGAALRALAQRLVMDPTTLTRNLKPLERAGLLRVARSPADRRARIVVLTKAGERTIEAAFPLWERAQKRLRGSFGESRVKRLGTELGGIVALAPRLEERK